MYNSEVATKNAKYIQIGDLYKVKNTFNALGIEFSCDDILLVLNKNQKGLITFLYEGDIYEFYICHSSVEELFEKLNDD